MSRHKRLMAPKVFIMLRLLQSALWFFARVLVSLRYRVHYHGLDRVKNLKGPILILPNHVGYIDPVIVLSKLGPYFHPRPLLFASNFHNPFLSPIMRILDALEVPDMDKPSKRARRQAEEAIQRLIAGLHDGRSHMLWPSGRAQRNGREVLGGARALTDILKQSPETTVLLVRTRGLWGSMYTFAQTGRPPAILAGAVRGLCVFLANLLVFTPRRRLDVFIEKLDRAQVPLLAPATLGPLDPDAREAALRQERKAVNRWFERWYNEEQGEEQRPETPIYRPYHFLSWKKDFAWPKPADTDDENLRLVTAQTRAAVAEVLQQKLGRSLAEADLRLETTLDSLGLDSLDRMDLSHRIEKRFGFSTGEVPINVGGLWLLAQGLVRAAPPKPAPEAWVRYQNRTRAHPAAPAEILADTVAEAFVSRALRDRKSVAVADDLAGALTYERLLVGALTVSRRLRPLPGRNVGLLLPASVGCDIAFLALHLAGKVPVVLNWTTGRANLGHAVKTMELKHVVTSEAFLDRLADDEEPPNVELVYLEDVRKKIGRVELLRTLFSVRWLPGKVRSQIPAQAPDDPAVVLFTSGSEKAPKTVPLIHRNILSNQQAAVLALNVTRADSLLAFLPAFHSFGMTITGLLPILTGLAVVRHPDPTDAGALTRKLAAYRPTLMVGTPTFASFIFDRAEHLLQEQVDAKINDPSLAPFVRSNAGSPGRTSAGKTVDLEKYLRAHGEVGRAGPLGSLRLIVVGAEKCPESLFERCSWLAPDTELLEGYGITECSPVVSVNPPGANRRGTIGKPVPGVEVCIVDLNRDSQEAGRSPDLDGADSFATNPLLGPGRQGMLLVAGPTVFPGYIGDTTQSPFVQRDGRRWYVTGDLVAQDQDGYLRFAGRLKRFLKAGGEMVSLPALEEPLVTQYPPDQVKGPRVAIEGIDAEHGRPSIVLFTTIAGLDLAQANLLLEKAGFRGVMRLTEVRHVESIPILGTGKTDYKKLRALLASNNGA